MSKFFSFKLYRQGLKKTKVAGVAILIAVTVLSALPSFLSLILSLRYALDSFDASTPKVIWSMAGNAGSYCYGLLLLLILAPLLTQNAFRFLNKRNESDFYHAIPFTRPCVFFSFIAAILTWLALTLVSTLTLVTVLRLCTPLTSVNIAAPILLLGLYLLALAMLVAFTALAMSITGTGVSNFFTFWILLSTVRICFALFLVGVDQLTPIWLPDTTFARCMEFTFNLPVALFIAPFTGSASLTDPALLLYTFVVTALLLVAGCWLYTRRKSEMAGQSAPARFWQHVLRAAACLPLLCGIVTLLITGSHLFDTIVIIFIVLLLLVYYLYEIITTKRLKNCISATPVLAVLLALGVLFGVSVKLTSGYILLYTPEAEDIRSVERDVSTYGSVTYEEAVTYSISTNDEEIKKIVSRSLKDAVNTIRTEGPDAYSRYYYQGGVWLRFLITDRSGLEYGRYLFLTHDQHELYWNRLRATEAYQKAWLSLPSADQIDSYAYRTFEFEESPQDPSVSKELWKRFVKDYNALSVEKKTEYKNSFSNKNNRSETIRISGSVNGFRFATSYPLLPEYFPTAYAYYMESVNSYYADDLQVLLTTSGNGVNCTTIVTVDGSTYDTYNEPALTKQCYTLLSGLPSSADDCIPVALQVRSGSRSATQLYLISEAELTELTALFKLFN